MKKTLFFLCLSGLSLGTLQAQTGWSPAANRGKSNGFIYGIRAGLNVASATNAASLGATPKLGYMIGLYADNSFGRLTGMRQEITYSRQGFHFNASGRRGSVDLHYLLVSNLFTLNLGNILQGHLGPQVAYLTNALADTVNNLNNSNVTGFFSIKNQTRRFVYGGCAGVEIYPYKGLLVGARYNLSFSPVSKPNDNMVYTRTYNNGYNQGTSTQTNEKGQVRNVVWQFVVGWRIGRGVNAK